VKKTLALLISLSILGASGAALADPPTVVGRLSLIEGAASVRHSYDQQWAAAGINYPVIAGDGVWSDQGSRTEIEIGAAEARLDQLTELDIDRLDDGGAALRVPQGVVNVTVRYLPPGGIQLLTAVGQLSILRPGEYHVDAGRPNGPPTQLLLGVINGEASFSGARGVVDLRSGQGAMVPPDQSTISVVSIYPTPFDQWAEDRTGQLAASQSGAYVSPDMTGYQDLDSYGSWQPAGDYGMVWFPTAVAIGWAPYRYGHWDYVRPWGWTWIDAAPWGFAPFHYGRWAMFDGRWGWIPGERHEHHYYAPALVAFVGGVPGERMEPGIGWVPLGPHEVFHPYYAHSDNYVLIVNRAHFRDEREFHEREAQWHDHPPAPNAYANRQAVTNANAPTVVNHQPPPQQPVQQPHAQPGQGFGGQGGQGGRPFPQQQAPQAQPQPAAAPPQPVQPHPQPAGGQPAPQYQPRPQPAAIPAPVQTQAPAPAPVAQQPRPVPSSPPPQPVQQPMPQYHPPQPVQQQPVQQPRPQPQPAQAPSQHREEKDERHDNH